MFEYIKRYYKNNKGELLFFTIIILLSIGPFILFTFIEDVKPMLKDPFVITFIILIVVGIILSLLYAFFIYIPITSPKGQDDKEYDITKEEDKIHVIFKNTELLISREDIYLNKKYFKDINNNRIPHLRLTQIYNYIKEKYPNLLEKEIDKNTNIITKEEIVNKFSNIRTMNTEEKEYYIKKKNLDYGLITPLIVCSVITILFLSISLASKNIIFILIVIILMFLLYLLAIKSYKKRNNLAKRIRNETMYIASCKIYDKKTVIEYNDETKVYNSYVKITDGKYIYNEWILIPQNKYNSNIDKIDICIFDDKASDIFEIL